MPGVVDLRTNQHAVHGRIDHRRDHGNPSHEKLAGIGQHRNLDLLVQMESGNVALGDIRQHPHGRDIGHRIRRRRVAGLDEQSRRCVSCRDAAGDRTLHHQPRISPPLADDLIDFGFGLAEDPNRIAGRPQGAFGTLLVRNRLFEILLCHRLGRIERLEARQRACGQFQDTRCRDQVRACRKQIRTVDGEQDLSLRDLVADFGEGVDDPPLIGREDLERHILVEIDAADCGFLGWKREFADLLDVDGGHLPVIELHARSPIDGSSLHRIGIADTRIRSCPDE